VKILLVVSLLGLEIHLSLERGGGGEDATAHAKVVDFSLYYIIMMTMMIKGGKKHILTLSFQSYENIININVHIHEQQQQQLRNALVNR
jgi:hypothetical protein